MKDLCVSGIRMFWTLLGWISLYVIVIFYHAMGHGHSSTLENGHWIVLGACMCCCVYQQRSMLQPQNSQSTEFDLTQTSDDLNCDWKEFLFLRHWLRILFPTELRMIIYSVFCNVHLAEAVTGITGCVSQIRYLKNNSRIYQPWPILPCL